MRADSKLSMGNQAPHALCDFDGETPVKIRLVHANSSGLQNIIEEPDEEMDIEQGK